MPGPRHDIITIGASAGGIEVLGRLVAQLREDIPASIFIVLHTATHTPFLLHEILGRSTTIPIGIAQDGATFYHGAIYVAPPDCHLLIDRGRMRVTAGPRENGTRPAIDPLFRSAAAAYTSRVIGVVLTGLLDDGTSGLMAIKKCGGIVMVQDPAEAPFKSMPESALAHVPVDFALPVSQMGDVLYQLALQPAGVAPPVPADILAEVKIAEGSMDVTDKKELMRKQSTFNCPECGGALWELSNGDVRRFRCNIGHGFTAQNLLEGEIYQIEQALWAAIRSLEDRARVLDSLARDAREKGAIQSYVANYESKAAESTENAQRIRSLLLDKILK